MIKYSIKYIKLVLYLGASISLPGVHAQVQLPKCVLYGLVNCMGNLKYDNGDVYSGEFNYGKPTGKGSFIYRNGDSYIGDVMDGHRHGSGAYILANGDKYVGQFTDGRFEGLGIYYFLADTKFKGSVYVGEFRNNMFNGDGKFTNVKGQTISGSFVDGKKVEQVAKVTLKSDAIASQTVNPEKFIERSTATAVDVKSEIPRDSSYISNLENSDLKVEEVPASVKTAQRLFGSIDVTDSNPFNTNGLGVLSSRKLGQIFATGTFSFVNGIQIGSTNSNITSSVYFPSDPTGISTSFGIGYAINANIGVEAMYKSLGRQTVNVASAAPLTYKANSLLLGGYLEAPLSDRLNITLRGGFGTTDSTFTATSTSTSSSTLNGVLISSSSSSSTQDFSFKKSGIYYGLGASYSISEKDKFTIDVTRIKAGLEAGSVLDVNFDVIDLGWKHSF